MYTSVTASCRGHARRAKRGGGCKRALKARPGMLPPVKLGERMRQIREAKGLSQAECADAAGITRQSWWHYESGHRPNPELSKLFTIARGLDVPLAELLAGVDEEP